MAREMGGKAGTCRVLKTTRGMSSRKKINNYVQSCIHCCQVNKSTKNYLTIGFSSGHFWFKRMVQNETTNLETFKYKTVSMK